MTKKPSFDNHYILLSSGEILDLLDPLVFDTDIETTVTKNVTVTKKCNSGIKMLQCADSPMKLFNEVTGLKKTGEFLRFGPSNWGRLFLIHGEYEYFLAYVFIDNVKQLVAKSLNGTTWTFNVTDA